MNLSENPELNNLPTFFLFLQIELELNDIISERNELHGQLTSLERVKTNLESELTTVTNTLAEKVKLIERLNSDKEGLTKENAEMEASIQHILLYIRIVVFIVVDC